jgi:hypothetical protein
MGFAPLLLREKGLGDEGSRNVTNNYYLDIIELEKYHG